MVARADMESASPKRQSIQAAGKLRQMLAAESGCYKLALSSNLKREKAHAFYDALDFERHGYSFRMALPAAPP